MTISKTQSVSGNGATLTLNSVVAGALLTLQDAYLRDPGTGAAEAVPTDTQGTWSIANSDVPPVLSTFGDRGVGTFYQANVASGTHTVTPQATTFHEALLAEWAGVATTSPFDVGTSAQSTAANHTSQATGTTGTTAQADELVLINCVEDSTTGTANIGWTDPVSGFTTLLSIIDDTTDLPTLPSYKIVSATGAQSATFNWTDSKPVQTSMANIATFKAASSAGPDNTQIPNLPRGGNFGPRLRRRSPQRFPDTIPFVQDGSGTVVSFRRGMGPRMRFRLAQRFPDVSLNAYSLPVVTGAYILTGVATPLQHNDDLVATTGTYVLTGIAAPLLHGYLVSPVKGTYVLTGMAVTFSRAYVLSAVTGVYSLTGRVLNLLVGRLVSAASGAYVLAGISDSFLRGYAVAPSSGPYVLVGNTATLTYSGATASPSPTQNPFLASAPKMMNRR